MDKLRFQQVTESANTGIDGGGCESPQTTYTLHDLQQAEKIAYAKGFLDGSKARGVLDGRKARYVDADRSATGNPFSLNDLAYKKQNYQDAEYAFSKQIDIHKRTLSDCEKLLQEQE